jgi:predicted lipoprotein
MKLAHVAFALAFLVASPHMAFAANAQKAVLRVTDSFVIPKYEALARATDAQERAWNEFCAKRETANATPLIAAYHKVADIWAEAQIVKTGPIVLFLRQERFYYWPEAHGATERALQSLIASNDARALEPATLAHDSVAGQGLPALERLLFEQNAIAQLKAKDGAPRCTVGQGIARNLKIIAHDVANEWKGAGGVRTALAANKSWRGMFTDANEATRLLLTDLVTLFRQVDDNKLLNVMGKDAASAKPKLAEAWRSGRAARDIQLNLKAAHAMADLFAADLKPADRAKLDKALNVAIVAANALPNDLGVAAADPKRRTKLEAARKAIKAAQSVVAAILPPALGVNLGFNALDSD